MDEFGVLVESIGFKANGRSAPLANLKAQKTKPTAAPNGFPVDLGFNLNSNPIDGSFVDQLDSFFRSDKSSQSHDDWDIFGGSFPRNTQSSGAGSVDDLLGAGTRQSHSVVDLLGNFGLKSEDRKSEDRKRDLKENWAGFDDLIPGFGGTSSSNSGSQTERSGSQQSTGRSTKSNFSSVEDPFSIFESSTPSENVEKTSVPSPIDELESFARGKAQNDSNETSNAGRLNFPAKNSANGSQEKFPDLKDLNRKPKAETARSIRTSFGRKDGATKQQANVDSPFDVNRGSKMERSHSEASYSTKKASATNFDDNFSSLFGDFVSPSGEFQEFEGESEDRRRIRWNNHIKTKGRMAEALAEKQQRDLQIQKEQDQKQILAETLDGDIKRWAAGKEGNLRALLSSLQYILWTESGWKPAPLNDLITSNDVNKVYKKARLCVHPDKVQQRGANLQQKYIAEKVFDLLQEAAKKFNAEELR